MKNYWKQHLALFLSLAAFFLRAPLSRAGDFDQGYRFIFYAVMEGCYEDGLSSNDVAQILLKNEKVKSYSTVYAHFIYACPVCMPTIHALEAYQSRPSAFYGIKVSWGQEDTTKASTFGPGLAGDLKEKLYSEKPEDQLAAINTLMQRWVSKRILLLRLTDKERADLQKTLEEMRKKGMGYLKDWEKSNPSQYQMSAFKNVNQCAVCNGACGLNLKPDAGK